MKSIQLWPKLDNALNDFLMYSSWHKKEFFWLVPAFAGGNENCMQKAKISALAVRDALSTLLSLRDALSTVRLPRQSCQISEGARRVTVIFPQRERADKC